MNIGTKEMLNDLLSSAEILVEAPNNIHWDLAHYIADLVIGKIMMLKLYEEKNYLEKDVENLKFPNLLKEFKKNFPEIELNYKEIQFQHNQGRNTFQHKLITNYLGIRQEQARLYVQMLHELIDRVGIYNPNPDFNILPKNSIPKDSIDPKEAIKFFIDKLSNREYEALLNRFHDFRFKTIFESLFTDIQMGTGSLELFSNSFVLAIGVEKIYAIKLLYNLEKKYHVGWDNMPIAEQVQVILNNFKENVKLIYGFDL